MKYTDYKVHYRVDADYIIPPEQLPAAQRASEKRRLKTILRTIGRRPGGRILDIGCGSGWLTKMVGQQGTQVVAMDISPAGVQKAKRWVESVRESGGAEERRSRGGPLSSLPPCSLAPPPNFVAADIYHLPFQDRNFRWVILSEVIEHLHDPDQALREIHRLLEDKGRVIITTPHRERIRYTLCIHCNQPTPVNAHLWSFTKGDVEARLGRCGFTPVTVGEVSNKVLEYFRFPWMIQWAPYVFWRCGDGFLNRFSRGAYLCIVAEKSDHLSAIRQHE